MPTFSLLIIGDFFGFFFVIHNLLSNQNNSSFDFILKYFLFLCLPLPLLLWNKSWSLSFLLCFPLYYKGKVYTLMKIKDLWSIQNKRKIFYQVQTTKNRTLIKVVFKCLSMTIETRWFKDFSLEHNAHFCVVTINDSARFIIRVTSLFLGLSI